jgi:hypothetical protein
MWPDRTCYRAAKRHLLHMCKAILSVLLITLATPALAASYPVSGNWGAGAPPSKGPIDCSKLRVIGFNGDQRTDSVGGVPAYRNVSVTPSGSSYRIVDVFTTGQISNANVSFTLRRVDADHLEMTQGGSTLKLQRCK